MATARARGDLGPACTKCGTLKTWSGTRWLCRPCQAEMNRNRRAGLNAGQIEAERIRANRLRNERRASWSPEQRASANAQVSRWREANRERHRQLSRDWYAANSEIKKAQAVARYKANPAPWLANKFRRQARMRDAVCAHGELCVTTEFLIELYSATCLYCAAPAERADHYFPLSKGGLHCIENLVPACHPCNASKYNHDPVEWLARRAAG